MPARGSLQLGPGSEKLAVWVDGSAATITDFIDEMDKRPHSRRGLGAHACFPLTTLSASKSCFFFFKSNNLIFFLSNITS